MNSKVVDSSSLFASIPDGLANPLLQAFQEILRNYRERRWEPSELNGGKLCECIYTILHGHVTGTFPAKPTKPKSMYTACHALEQAGDKFPRSIRIQIPRVIIALYEIRNNRGVGHTGGDVDPNSMDAAYVVASAKWLMAELVRIFHSVDIAAAQATVNALTERTLPIVWEIGGQRRLLATKLNRKHAMLVLLYSRSDPVEELSLLGWLEQDNAAAFRRDVIRPAHRSRLIEYDQAERTLTISPLGISYVEKNLPLEIAL